MEPAFRRFLILSQNRRNREWRIAYNVSSLYEAFKIRAEWQRKAPLVNLLVLDSLHWTLVEE
jgi:hypothetical protein